MLVQAYAERTHCILREGPLIPDMLVVLSIDLVGGRKKGLLEARSQHRVFLYQNQELGPNCHQKNIGTVATYHIDEGVFHSRAFQPRETDLSTKTFLQYIRCVRQGLPRSRRCVPFGGVFMAICRLTRVSDAG